MFMLKFFFNHPHRDPDGQEAADPLSHPDLTAMSLTELADLPLMPENLGRLRACDSTSEARRT